MARIALDAMGGDFAPRATVAGALHALAELDPVHTIQLVGQTTVVEAQLRALLDGELSSHASYRNRLSIIEAPDVIEMTDKPSAAVRGKPNSSMAVGLRLQAEGKSDAFVSAGSTGAQMAASLVILRLHAGLKRPAIATLFPPRANPSSCSTRAPTWTARPMNSCSSHDSGRRTRSACSGATTPPSDCSASARRQKKGTP